MTKVAIVGRDTLTERMFVQNGFTIVPLLGGDDPDLVQFTGGEDVDPSLYGDARHPSTHSNPSRDSRESHVYRSYVGKAVLAGICRGGQFLNVMNGGSMYQHVDGHYKSHGALDLLSGEKVEVTSCHHQMMIPNDKAELLLSAEESQVKWKGQTKETKVFGDVEALYYPETRSLCFQPHPEYEDLGEPCQQLYFRYLKHFFNFGG